MKVTRTSMESRLASRQALQPVSLFQGLDIKQYKQRKREFRRKRGGHAEPEIGGRYDGQISSHTTRAEDRVVRDNRIFAGGHEGFQNIRTSM